MDTQVRGIMNGTTNFMLTKMEEGADYANVLAEAQALGYAEGTHIHRKTHIYIHRKTLQWAMPIFFLKSTPVFIPVVGCPLPFSTLRPLTSLVPLSSDAPADPTADVEGHDVQAKIALLAKLAFGTSVPLDKIPTKGISAITRYFHPTAFPRRGKRQALSPFSRRGETHTQEQMRQMISWSRLTSLTLKIWF